LQLDAESEARPRPGPKPKTPAAGAVEQVIAKTETLASLARSTADEISALLGRRAIRPESEPAIA
jgi:hypothetical protein